MIKTLNLKNVGTTPTLELTLAERINVLTGDNGLGKSFLLDIIWWCLTRTWPQSINTKLKSGYMAKPIAVKEKASIHFSIIGKTARPAPYTATYIPREEIWKGPAGRPANPGLVIYTMSDGSFALWDPARNYWVDGEDRKKENAQVFSQSEIWDGFSNEKTSTYFSGLLRDWELWQSAKTKEFEQLKDILKTLSTEDEPLELGELKTFRLDDDRRYPTLNTTYGKNILFPHLSSGVKRIITLTYFLVYAWKRHCESAEAIGEEQTKQITFLIDEMEAHLHPKWQRQIVPSILKMMENLSSEAKVQLITATHSPLVMASLEPIFNEGQDAWIDLDIVDKKVQVETKVFEKLGTADNWLESEAFDLSDTRAISYENLIKEAQSLISPRRERKASQEEITEMRKKLAMALDPRDEFLFYWRALCQKQGYL